MKPIYILALWNVRTGGPEATHQLSDALLSQGFDARLVYFDFEQIRKLEHATPQDGYHFGARTNQIEEYAHYKTNPVDAVPNSADVIVVLPETLCHLAPFFDKATVLIWWLSVDNAFGALSRVSLNWLRGLGVHHAFQSQYARRFLDSIQVRNAKPLSDYIADFSAYAKPVPWALRPRLVAFNASHKVSADLQMLADVVGKIDPSIACSPLRGLSRQELALTYANARVYVDLGTFPGKDRGPREAAAMGCYVLLAPNGAAVTDLQNWIYERYAYLPDLIVAAANGSSQSRAVLRGSFGSEREIFNKEVREIFFGLADMSAAA